MIFLAEAYDGTDGVEQDLQTSFEWWKAAAEAGAEEAYYNLGKCYENAKGTKGDRRKALEWYLRAAKAGDCHAMNDVGIYFANGYVSEVDEEEAFKWFKKAATNEDYAGAMYNLATCYENGIGTEENAEEALRLRFLALNLEQKDNEELVYVK